MGFFSKLKKVVSGVDKGAAIASGVLPGKAGKIAGQVAQGAGVVTAVVQQIHAKDLPPEEAQKQATLATAVAVDDHEERMKALEAELAALRAGSAAQGAQSGQSGSTKQAGAAASSGKSSKSGTSSRSGKKSGGSGGR